MGKKLIPSKLAIPPLLSLQPVVRFLNRDAVLFHDDGVMGTRLSEVENTAEESLSLSTDRPV